MTVEEVDEIVVKTKEVTETIIKRSVPSIIEKALVLILTALALIISNFLISLNFSIIAVVFFFLLILTFEALIGVVIHKYRIGQLNKEVNVIWEKSMEEVTELHNFNWTVNFNDNFDSYKKQVCELTEALTNREIESEELVLRMNLLHRLYLQLHHDYINLIKTLKVKNEVDLDE